MLQRLKPHPSRLTRLLYHHLPHLQRFPPQIFALLTPHFCEYLPDLFLDRIFSAFYHHPVVRLPPDTEAAADLV